MTLEGRYTNLAGCEICTAYPGQDGRTMYGCPCPSGIVVLDAVTGDVRMVDHVMRYGHYFENEEFSPLFVEN
jgi:hypothetical protein